jgi:hypothetical protein
VLCWIGLLAVAFLKPVVCFVADIPLQQRGVWEARCPRVRMAYHCFVIQHTRIRIRIRIRMELAIHSVNTYDMELAIHAVNTYDVLSHEHVVRATSTSFHVAQACHVCLEESFEMRVACAPPPSSTFCIVGGGAI